MALTVRKITNGTIDSGTEFLCVRWFVGLHLCSEDVNCWLKILSWTDQIFYETFKKWTCLPTGPTSFWNDCLEDQLIQRVVYGVTCKILFIYFNRCHAIGGLKLHRRSTTNAMTWTGYIHVSAWSMENNAGSHLVAALCYSSGDDAHIRPGHGKKQNATTDEHPLCTHVRWLMKFSDSSGSSPEIDQLHKTRSGATPKKWMLRIKKTKKEKSLPWD